MKESLDRSELRRMQREQERERRRIRDRQRRQSMTVEQRERHLARRRRNYQLRRLRAENAKVDCQSQHISNEHEEAAAAEGNEGNDAQEVTQTEKLSTERLHYSECLEAAACKSANFTIRLRLSHIRRLARSLNHLGGEAIGNHQIVADVITKGDANNTSCFRIGDFDSGRLPNGLRLNRVKRLARTLNIAAHETSVNCPKVDQNVSAEEVPATGDDKPKFGQTIRVGGDVEGPNMDG
ncbi:PREDICTED: uncharacterized protein LOC103326965 isoform X4 [Prunus mume]|nr:PREDICTED: uncharacterized protein LOC103326965 isoform X4 [Prunus mume]